MTVQQRGFHGATPAGGMNLAQDEPCEHGRMMVITDVSTMDPAERGGYLGALAIFLVAGIVLVVFGIRRLMKRSEMQRRRQYGPPPGWPQQPGMQPGPYAPQPTAGKPERQPPGLGGSIAMIVIGGLLLLGVLGNLANAAGGGA